MKNLILGALLLCMGQLTAQYDASDETKYRRSSLYTLMVTDPTRTNEEAIKEYFSTRLIPVKFNDHNLDNRFIMRSDDKDQEGENLKYFEEVHLPNQLVAKWFNRKADGTFDMNLIRERGFYDASILDISQAKLNVRGLSMLADAGEELIGNTFVLVLDSRYLNKEDVGKVANAGIGFLSNKLGALGSLAAKTAVKTVAKGYMVSTNAYLYRLVWDEEATNRFFNEMWLSEGESDEAKKAAFDQASFFKLSYVGKDKAISDVQSSALTNKTDEELIGRATIKSIDNVISKLQKEHDVFKTKTPIISVDPVRAHIGLKEGLTEKTQFAVLEQQQDENGRTKYVEVGKVKVSKKHPIWDNQYGADEENPNQTVTATTFDVTSGKNFYPGMLLRQIKN